MPGITIISDIDGTVAHLNAARINLLRKGDWVEFAQGTASDQPIWPVIRILQQAFQRGYRVHFHTGRGEATRTATESWLWRYNIPYERLLMRHPGDTRRSVDVKRDFLGEGPYAVQQIAFVLEDRPNNVLFYVRRGYIVLQPHWSGPGGAGDEPLA